MPSFFEQYRYNTSPGPEYLSQETLPSEPPRSYPVRFIAYYLPQFHAIAENNKWWGEGFTEWTNVTKAVPRYVGHRQPNLPADLGFYDLTNLEVLRRQTQLAKRAGIYGFCIHNYWFSGKQVLETPLNNLLSAPDIDLRFCLNWANEDWTRRWDGSDSDVLLKQHYAVGDDIAYAKSILPALRDPRYIRVNGRPLLMVYRPSLLPDAKAWTAAWRRFFNDNGVGDPYLVMAQSFGYSDPRPFGFDGAAGFPPHNGGWDILTRHDDVNLLDPAWSGRLASFAALIERILRNETSEYVHFPGVCPRWDNEARKPGSGVSFYDASPEMYGSWLTAASATIGSRSNDERIVFINAWNEWAEGAYLEPDRHYGHAYLSETRRVLDALSGKSIEPFPYKPASARDYALSSPKRRVRTPANTIYQKLLNRLFGPK
jgi:lipopolysaccharide biosynthesis protein